jgi:hypothetical protein
VVTVRSGVLDVIDRLGAHTTLLAGMTAEFSDLVPRVSLIHPANNDVANTVLSFCVGRDVLWPKGRES